MAAFLDVHARINLECDSQLVLPFLYPEEQMSGLDIVFVVRFSDLAPNDDTEGSSSTLSPDSASSDITCPVFV